MNDDKGKVLGSLNGLTISTILVCAPLTLRVDITMAYRPVDLLYMPSFMYTQLLDPIMISYE